MRKKLIASLSILAIFAFAIAAFAYTQNTNTLADKPSCCKSKDSCPMKAKGHEGNADHAKMDCCGDSCPMKKGERAATAGSATDEGKDCCDNCDCCKGKTEKSA